jgi:hypothetical protein
MSLPLSRRIARAALLIAAGAAPVVGAAGSAGAVELQQANPLGGLTALDTQSLGGTVESAAGKSSDLAGSAGGDTVKQTVPAAGRAVTGAGRTATPATRQATGDAADSAGDLLGGTATAAAGSLTGGDVASGSLAGSGLSEGKLPLG